MTDSVKIEDNVRIKNDPESAMPSIVDDFDYEDTGELEIPKQQIEAWLLRLPRELYEKWATLAEDQPIQLGHVRHFKNSDKVSLSGSMYVRSDR